MSSEDYPEAFGRTGWDVLAASKKVLLVTIVLAVSIAAVYAVGRLADMSGLRVFAEEYWAVFVSPLAGWMLGRYVAKNLYRPQGRYVTVMYPDIHLFRVVFIPEASFRMMSQSGNNVCYHTAGGAPLYVAQDLDLRTGEIRYGWVHELDAIQVMTREHAFVKWDSTLNEILEENLELISHPHIIGLGYARHSLRTHLDDLAKVLGFTEADYEPHRVVREDPDDEEPEQGDEAEEPDGRDKEEDE